MKWRAWWACGFALLLIAGQLVAFAIVNAARPRSEGPSQAGQADPAKRVPQATNVLQLHIDPDNILSVVGERGRGPACNLLALPRSRPRFGTGIGPTSISPT